MIKKIPFFKPSIGKDEIDAVSKVLKSGWLTLGPKVKEFETKIAKYLGCKYVIATNSCTSCFVLLFSLLNIKKDDEIIIPSFNYVSIANVIVQFGAKPIFIDIEKNTYNINSKKIEEAITTKTKAIVPVHFGGIVCNLKKINKIASKHRLIVIEDAAHAFGGYYNNKKIGNSKNFTCFSFHATKNITTGKGGIITTNNKLIAQKLQLLRNNGITKSSWQRNSGGKLPHYGINIAGFNCYMNDISATIGICQLKKINKFQKKRNLISKKYYKKLSKLNVTLPKNNYNGNNNIFHLFPILLNSYSREKFIKKMNSKGIKLSIHFPPIHLQSYYIKNYNPKHLNLKVTENIYKKIISLPIYPSLKTKEQDYICKCIKEILK